MSKSLQNLREALFATGLVQPLESSGKGGTLNLLCRQVPGQEKPWLKMVEKLLKKEAEGTGYELHLCRRYKLANDQLAFGWMLSISARTSKIVDSVIIDLLIPVLAEARPELTPVEQTPQTQQQYRSPRLVTSTSPQPARQLVQVVERKKDPVTGKEAITYEMPLPSAAGRMNENFRNGKGAHSIGGSTGSFSPPSRNGAK